MKKIKLSIVSFIVFTISACAQEIPDIKLATLEGNIVSTGTLNTKESKITVLAFWATWCIPCINELSVINEDLPEWKKENQFNFLAVSEDDSRTINRVRPLVNGKNWDFSVLLDKNQDLKRQLNLGNIPYTIVVKEGKIIYRHSGYVMGDEEALIKVIKDNQ